MTTRIDRSTYQRYGPWPCPSCDEDSAVPYRCTSCGYELEGKGSTAGREDR